MKALISLAHRSRLYNGQGSEYLFALAGLGWVFCGALVLGLSTSTTHEITASLLISFGVMFLGLSALLGQIRVLGMTWKAAQPKILPPPVPIGYAIPIEEAIDDVRTSVRLAERQAWIQSFSAGRSEIVANSMDDVALKRISYLRGGILPESLPPSIEHIEDDSEYYIEQPWPRY
jgi:hypothetical protein